MKIVYYKDKQGLWRWRAVSRNGRIIAESGEGYTRRARAIDGLNSFISGLFD